MERIGLNTGDELGGYRIVAPLGSGGMGTVYRAQDAAGNPVALKLLRHLPGGDTDARARLAREVAALQRLRHPDVVHRDVKPANVLMTSQGPVLIDFGIAQAGDDARLTQVGLVAGTPGYLAPELLDGADPSAASDWWGWAAVLAFAGTGRPPFGSGSTPAVLARVRSGLVQLG